MRASECALKFMLQCNCMLPSGGQCPPNCEDWTAECCEVESCFCNLSYSQV